MFMKYMIKKCSAMVSHTTTPKLAREKILKYIDNLILKGLRFPLMVMVR